MRSPDQVMRLARMGAAHQTRLSFKRSLLRMLSREGWRFDRPVWELDESGYGTAVYRASGPERSYSLVAFSHHLSDDQRSDRVIATAWDSTFTLFDGMPTRADLDRLRAHVPLQEGARLQNSELTLSRANRSVRVFDHVIESLAAGDQPDRTLIDSVGYLMRTTAVYGSGKFGAADRRAIVDRPECQPSFRIEMLTVWLIRAFTVDLVEHIAANRSPETAVRLSADLRRSIGVGNSTGLGMAPFLVNHPVLLQTWVEARETAIARVRAVENADDRARGVFLEMLERARRGAASWRTEDPSQSAAIDELEDDLARLDEHVSTGALDADRPWDRLWLWSVAELGLEAQELLVSLMIEPYGELVDHLADELFVVENPAPPIDGSLAIGTLVSDIETTFTWALSPDYSTTGDTARFWYTSEEKLEPRLGERHEEPGAELELPLAVGRDVAALHHAATHVDETMPVSEFLTAHPQHRHSVRRVLLTRSLPYAEIRDNLICETMRPVDLLRFKLAYFGASRFDPKSDRWTRITLFQHAPHPDELATSDPDDWAHAPPLSGPGGTPRGPGWGPPISDLIETTPAALPSQVVDCAPSQLEALTKKAVRGADHGWGLAEDVARTATWLEQRGLPGARAVAAALTAEDGADPSPTCLAIAPGFSDHMGLDLAAGQRAWTIETPAPMLLIRCVAERAAHIGRDATIRWADTDAGDAIVVRCGSNGSVNGATTEGWNWQHTPTSVDIVVDDRGDSPSSPDPGQASPRLSVDERAWQVLEAFAHRSYVPATEASRLAGAGAGLLDND